METAKGILIDERPLVMELEQIARSSIKSALIGYDLDGIPNRLFVKHKENARKHTFELWVAGDGSSGDFLISSAIVDAETKKVDVKVHGLSLAQKTDL